MFNWLWKLTGFAETMEADWEQYTKPGPTRNQTYTPAVTDWTFAADGLDITDRLWGMFSGLNYCNYSGESSELPRRYSISFRSEWPHASYLYTLAGKSITYKQHGNGSNPDLITTGLASIEIGELDEGYNPARGRYPLYRTTLHLNDCTIERIETTPDETEPTDAGEQGGQHV